MRSPPISPEADSEPTYFQKLLEAQTKHDLEWFFDDWVYRDRGLPDFQHRYRIFAQAADRRRERVRGHGDDRESGQRGSGGSGRGGDTRRATNGCACWFARTIKAMPGSRSPDCPNARGGQRWQRARGQDRQQCLRVQDSAAAMNEAHITTETRRARRKLESAFDYQFKIASEPVVSVQRDTPEF